MVDEKTAADYLCVEELRQRGQWRGTDLTVFVHDKAEVIIRYIRWSSTLIRFITFHYLVDKFRLVVTTSRFISACIKV